MPAFGPAGDYTASGTGAAGGIGTEVEESRGGVSDATHSCMADDSRGKTSDISSKSISEAASSGGEIDDIADFDGPHLRNPKIRPKSGSCRASDGRTRATSGTHEDGVHIPASKNPRRSARSKRRMSPERQRAEKLTEAQQSEDCATQPHEGHGNVEDGTKEARETFFCHRHSPETSRQSFSHCTFLRVAFA